MRLPLTGGSYSPRSIIANAQRCINYYPERNTKDALVPITHYQRPGLRPLVQGPNGGPVRGLYKASNNTAYCVIGATFYQITGEPNQGGWTLASLGTLSVPKSTPVSMTDNRTNLVLVDGTSSVYTLALNTGGATLQPYSDPNGLFAGADRVDYIDTFTIWNFPGGATNLFGSTLSNVLTTDPLYEAAKTNWVDNLQTLIVNRHVILLIGQQTTEVWYNAGNPNFPFAELPGAFYEHGTIAKYSVASQDISVYFLGEDKQGQGIVFRVTGFECKRVSNHALEYQIRQMAAQGSISDAIGFTYQFDGHVFYCLTFPTGNQTWQFDEASDEWTQMAWTDSDGNLNRHRANCFAYMFGTSVVGDWENGTLYAMDANVYTDTLVPAGQPGPVTYIRSFPHIGQGTVNLGGAGLDRPVESDGREMQFNSFMADIECGKGPAEANGNPASVYLRWSADRGRTFGNALLQSTGRPGQYRTRPKWNALGIGQDVVFELEHSIAGPAALNGAWVSAVILNQ